MPKKTDIKKITAPAKKAPAKKAPAKKAPTKKAPAKKLASSKKRSTPISSYKGRKGEKFMSAAMKKHLII